MTQADERSLIPRRVLFGNPDKALPTLSPDGTQIAFLAPADGVMNVWVGPAGTLSAARPVTSEEDRGIEDFYWAYTNRHILYRLDELGDDNWHVYAVDLDTGMVTDLTPIDGVQAGIGTRSISPGAGAFSPGRPNDIAVAMNDQRPQFHDVYLVDLTTGNRRLVQEASEEMQCFMLDDRYEVRFALRSTVDGGAEELIRTEDGGWELFRKVAMEDVLTYRYYGFDRTRSVRYMQDSGGRDTVAVVATDLATGESEVIAEDPSADVKDAIVHPSEKNVQAVAFAYERTEWKILDDSIRPDMEYLSNLADGEIEIVSRSADGDRWIVAYRTDTGPVLFYLYDEEHRSADLLFADRDDLEGHRFAEMHSSVIKSRDGLDMVSYYSLPPGSVPDDHDRPTSPLPMVVVVHGGPYSRDVWGFMPTHQLLANRGYAVLSVNFRGSVGFGKEFLNAANLEWGGKMQDDLITDGSGVYSGHIRLRCRSLGYIQPRHIGGATSTVFPGNHRRTHPEGRRSPDTKWQEILVGAVAVNSRRQYQDSAFGRPGRSRRQDNQV